MRIPVVFGGAAGPADAVLVEDGFEMPASGYAVRFATAGGKPGHFPGCACCTVRGPAADALGRLFMARARAEAPLFERVVVLASEEGEAAVRQAVQEDVVISARYKL